MTTRDAPTAPEQAGQLLQRREAVRPAQAAAAADNHPGGGQRDARASLGRLGGAHPQAALGGLRVVDVHGQRRALAGVAATASAATVSSAGDATRGASSSSTAHRRRTIRYVPGSLRSAQTQLAAIGTPLSAPRWASTSLPRSVFAAAPRGCLPGQVIKKQPRYAGYSCGRSNSPFLAPAKKASHSVRVYT